MISADTIEAVRAATDIAAVIGEHVRLTPRGRSYVGRCPFNGCEEAGEVTGFHVNPERGFYHCFGCPEAGSAIDFVMQHDRVTLGEAVHALAARAGVTVVTVPPYGPPAWRKFGRHSGSRP